MEYCDRDIGDAPEILAISEDTLMILPSLLFWRAGKKCLDVRNGPYNVPIRILLSLAFLQRYHKEAGVTVNMAGKSSSEENEGCLISV